MIGADPRLYAGILGGGNISDTHARAAAGVAAVRVSAVYGQNVARAAKLAERAAAVAYDDLDRFLDHRPMDFVAIGSPSGLHAEQAIAAISRGLHVIDFGAPVIDPPGKVARSKSTASNPTSNSPTTVETRWCTLG